MGKKQVRCQERQLEKFFPAGHLVFNEQLEGSGSVTVC
jgi:hypothetical protein